MHQSEYTEKNCEVVSDGVSHSLSVSLKSPQIIYFCIYAILNENLAIKSHFMIIGVLWPLAGPFYCLQMNENVNSN